MSRQPRLAISASYQRMIKNLPVGMAVLQQKQYKNRRTWSLIAINLLAERLMGASMEAFLAGTVAQNLPEAMARDMLQLLGEIAESGTRHFLGHHFSGDPSSRRLVFAVAAFPLSHNCIGISFEDVTDYRRAKKEALEAQARFHEVSEAVHAIVWRAEPGTFRFTYISKEAEKILGYWVERWSGETNFFKNHTHTDDRERVANLCARAEREDRAYEFDFRMIAADGRLVWLHALVRPVVLPEGRKELAGVMTDITARKRAEEDARELSARLLHSQDEERRRISRELHDSLGQYLAALKMNLDHLCRAGSHLEEHDRRAIGESVELAKRCVNDVRTVSYLLHPPLLDELGLSSALRWHAQGFSERSGVRTELEIAANLGRLSREAETAIFRIMQECLTNVHRHSQSDSVRIRLSRESDEIVLEVEDRGIGMAPEARERIGQGKEFGGVGIRGMRERMRELKGRFEIRSGDNGTLIVAAIPDLTPSNHTGTTGAGVKPAVKAPRTAHHLTQSA